MELKRWWWCNKHFLAAQFWTRWGPWCPIQPQHGAEVTARWARSFALLVNSFFSLFGPGISVVKWLLLEACTYAETLNGSNSTCNCDERYICAAPFISTDLIYLTFWIDSKMEMWASCQQRATVRYHEPVFVVYATLNRLQRKNKRAAVVEFLLTVFFLPVQERSDLMSSCIRIIHCAPPLDREMQLPEINAFRALVQ